MQGDAFYFDTACFIVSQVVFYDSIFAGSRVIYIKKVFAARIFTYALASITRSFAYIEDLFGFNNIPFVYVILFALFHSNHPFNLEAMF